VNRYGRFVARFAPSCYALQCVVKASRVGHAAEAGSLVAMPGSPLA
jgi:hypothetical protein